MADDRNSPLPATPLALVGDAGGTNCRFALARDGVLQRDTLASFATASFPSLTEAARHYLRGQAASVDRACVAIAGPVAGDRVHLTNNPWQFSIEQTRIELGLNTLQVINDFEAIGLSLPHLQPHQLEQIGGGAAIAGRPKVALGPGTGYGATHVVEAGGQSIALPTEGGHISLAPGNELELKLCQWLLERDSQVICEHLVSGPGLETIYRALATWQGEPNTSRSAAEIQHAAVDAAEPLCVAALNLFCELLGTAARDQALSCLARGGVYIAGGIVQRFVPFLRQSNFRERFELSPTMHDVLAPIPVYVITESVPGLVGAAAQCR